MLVELKQTEYCSTGRNRRLVNESYAACYYHPNGAPLFRFVFLKCLYLFEIPCENFAACLQEFVISIQDDYRGIVLKGSAKFGPRIYTDACDSSNGLLDLRYNSDLWLHLS